MGTGRRIIGLLVVGFIGSAILGDRSDDAPWRDSDASPASALSEPSPTGSPQRSAAAADPAGEESASTPASRRVVVVEATALRMRSEPSGTAPVIGSYPRGTEMILQESQGNWYRVTSPDGTSGWMAAAFLSEPPD
jgi:N-acetylmuramoyl-L-alanine amidase